MCNKFVAATATATSAMSIGTGNRASRMLAEEEDRRGKNCDLGHS